MREMNFHGLDVRAFAPKSEFRSRENFRLPAVLLARPTLTRSSSARAVRGALVLRTGLRRARQNDTLRPPATRDIDAREDMAAVRGQSLRDRSRKAQAVPTAHLARCARITLRRESRRPLQGVDEPRLAHDGRGPAVGSAPSARVLRAVEQERDRGSDTYGLPTKTRRRRPDPSLRGWSAHARMGAAATWAAYTTIPGHSVHHPRAAERGISSAPRGLSSTKRPRTR